MATTFFAKKANNEGKVHIFVRVRQKRTGFDCRMGTNLFLDERVWNHIDDPVYLEKFKNNKIINDILLIMDDIFKTCQEKLRQEDIYETKVIQDIVRDCVYREQQERLRQEEEERRLAAERENRMTFRKYVDLFYQDAVAGIRLTEKNTVYTHGSLTSIKQAIDHLRAFEAKSNRSYDFDDINMDFYRKYLAFLNGENYALNTIGKNINWLKTFLNAAQTEGYHNNAAFKNRMFKGARVEVDTIYLTKEDLDKIRAVDLSGKSAGYDLARDIFMIGVWTAQRISDYNNIRREDIKTHSIKKVVEKEDPDNPGQMIETIEKEEILVVNITQRKTGARVAIPCSSELRRIFEKYNYEIPHLSDQNVNDNMKKIAEWAGLDEPIKVEYIEGGKRITEVKKKYELVHTHTARRTGATLMYLSGMDFYDIMKITGHATVQNLKKYIKADEVEVLEKLVDKYDYFK